MYHRVLVAVAALAGLSGCIATSIPPGMPTAMIRVTSNASTIFAPACISDRNYVFNGLIGNQYWSEVSPVKMYGTRPDKNNQVIERLIPAERAIAFLVSGGSEDASSKLVKNCRVTVGFIPKAGEQYHLQFTLGEDKCWVNLYKMTLERGQIVRTPITPMQYRVQEDACI